MNYTYPKLAETVFPNALVIYDRFHITNALNRSLNKTRIQVMKALPVSSLGYKQLKRYWKLLLMAPEKLNYKFCHRWTYFKNWLTADGVVDELLAINPILSATYMTLHQLLSAIRRRDWQTFKLNLKTTNEVSELLKKSLTELNKKPEYIENALEYRYSNGPLEGTNNKLKVLIRNAYGFRNFNQYRLRALYTLKFRKKENHMLM
jgi:transposase